MEVIIAALIASTLSFLGVWLQEKTKTKNLKLEKDLLIVAKQDIVKEHSDYKKDVELHGKMLVFDLTIINKIQRAVEDIFNNTNSERFLILIAYNGVSFFRMISVVYEQHKFNNNISLSLGATNKYSTYKPDLYYLEMLKKAENNNYLLLKTEDMPDCDLKSFYQSEDVYESYIFHLLRVNLDASNDLLTYCSVATHKKEGFNPKNLGRIRADISVVAAQLDIMFKHNATY